MRRVASQTAAAALLLLLLLLSPFRRVEWIGRLVCGRHGVIVVVVEVVKVKKKLKQKISEALKILGKKTQGGLPLISIVI